MKRLKYLLPIAVLLINAFSFISCNSKDYPAPEPINYVLSLETENLLFELDETEHIVKVTTENVAKWSVNYENKQNDSWLNYEVSDNTIVVTVTRLEEFEENQTGKLIINDDDGNAKNATLTITMKIKSGELPPPPPEYEMNLDKSEVTLEAHGEDIETIVVTTNVPSWTPVVGLNYTSWLSVKREGDNVLIWATAWNDNLNERSGIVSIVCDDEELEPVEIKVTQLKKPWGTTQLNTVAFAYYYGNKNETGTAYFEVELEQENVHNGFRMAGYLPLAADPDNFVLEEGEYTFSSNSNGTSKTLRPGEFTGSGSSMSRNHFEGTFSFLYYPHMTSVYSNGVLGNNGKITVERNGSNYKITAQMSGNDMRTGEPSEDLTIYIFEGPIVFENMEPQQIETITYDVDYLRATFNAYTKEMVIFMLPEGRLNESGKVPSGVAYKNLELRCINGRENNDAKTPWQGTYRVAPSSEWNTSEELGLIRQGIWYDNSLLHSNYAEHDGTNFTLRSIITDGTLEVSQGPSEREFTIRTQLIAKNVISGNEVKLVFNYTGEFNSYSPW